MAKKKNQFCKKVKICYMKISRWSGLWIVGNLALAAVLALSIIYGSSRLLEKGTRHGESFEVPDFEGKTWEETKSLAKKAGVRVEIIDSIYVLEGRGTVARQNPAAGSKVKEDRRIMIVMRAKGAQKVLMPGLVNNSIQDALPELESRGLRVGKLIYDESDPCTNLVIRQQFNGREIAPGDMLEAESSIDLVLGLSSDDAGTTVPDMVGKRGVEAKHILNSDYYLSVNMRYDKDVDTYKERAHAVVYKQTPSSSPLPVRKGTEVTLYLKLESSEK